MNHHNRKHGARELPHIFLMTDDAMFADGAEAVANVVRTLDASWTDRAAIVIRARDPNTLAARAIALRAICATRNIGLWLGVDSVDGLRAARKLHTDGIHLSERFARRGPGALRALGVGGGINRRAGKPWLSVAAHSHTGLWRAGLISADGAMLSPVFATQSHIDRAPFGPWRWLAVAHRAPVAVIALGGMTQSRARRLSVAKSKLKWAALGAWHGNRN